MATALMATEIVNDEILNSSPCVILKNREKMREKMHTKDQPETDLITGCLLFLTKRF